MRTLRKVTPTTGEGIEWAIILLKAARDHLRHSGAKKSADYVARAIKSAEGARRHYSRCLFVQNYYPEHDVHGNPECDDCGRTAGIAHVCNR